MKTVIIGETLYTEFSSAPSQDWGMDVSTGNAGGPFLSPQAITDRLNTLSFGRKILHTYETGSTNDDAKTICGIVPEGTALISEVQTKGKGRVGRTWVSPVGGIFMSVILKPKIEASAIPGLSLVVGYAVANALKANFGVKAIVKWPNDVLIEDQKIAGILCEMHVEPDQSVGVIVGIGLNANTPLSNILEETGGRAVSLSSCLGKPVNKAQVIAILLNEFERHYTRFTEFGLKDIAKDINNVLAYRRKNVVVQNQVLGSSKGFYGVLEGIDEEGRLILKMANGSYVQVSAGDVSLRPSNHDYSMPSE